MSYYQLLIYANTSKAGFGDDYGLEAKSPLKAVPWPPIHLSQHQWHPFSEEYSGWKSYLTKAANTLVCQSAKDAITKLRKSIFRNKGEIHFLTIDNFAGLDQSALPTLATYISCTLPIPAKQNFEAWRSSASAIDENPNFARCGFGLVICYFFC